MTALSRQRAVRETRGARTAMSASSLAATSQGAWNLPATPPRFLLPDGEGIRRTDGEEPSANQGSPNQQYPPQPATLSVFHCCRSSACANLWLKIQNHFLIRTTCCKQTNKTQKNKKTQKITYFFKHPEKWSYPFQLSSSRRTASICCA